MLYVSEPCVSTKDYEQDDLYKGKVFCVCM